MLPNQNQVHQISLYNLNDAAPAFCERCVTIIIRPLFMKVRDQKTSDMFIHTLLMMVTQ